VYYCTQVFGLRTLWKTFRSRKKYVYYLFLLFLLFFFFADEEKERSKTQGKRRQTKKNIMGIDTEGARKETL
jgi:hypothetical protein